MLKTSSAWASENPDSIADAQHRWSDDSWQNVREWWLRERQPPSFLGANVRRSTLCNTFGQLLKGGRIRLSGGVCEWL